mgnify:CR=1 FL=1
MNPATASGAPSMHLESLLSEFYPRAAAEQGIEGTVWVTAVIGPDGRVSQIRVTEDPGHGFADACRRTLNASRWSPPIDRGGAAVSQRIRFSCTFEMTGF